VLDSIERLMVGRALEQSDGKVEDAAQRLGISRKGLFLKRKRWGTQPERGE
jgi:DNA-binding NtrC family response regulator